MYSPACLILLFADVAAHSVRIKWIPWRLQLQPYIDSASKCASKLYLISLSLSLQDGASWRSWNFSIPPVVLYIDNPQRQALYRWVLSLVITWGKIALRHWAFTSCYKCGENCVLSIQPITIWTIHRVQSTLNRGIRGISFASSSCLEPIIYEYSGCK